MFYIVSHMLHLVWDLTNCDIPSYFPAAIEQCENAVQSLQVRNSKQRLLKKPMPTREAAEEVAGS